MLTSNSQVFENDWATVKFNTEEPYRIPFVPSTPYTYTIPLISTNVQQSGIQLAIDQCRRIYDIYQIPLNVFLSGGVDSQAVVFALSQSGVPFVVSIIEFDNGLNSHDVKFAKQLCQSLSIEPNVIKLNILDFYTSGRYNQFTLPYLCDSPQIALHLYAVHITNMIRPYVFVFGGNPIMPISPHKYGGVQQFTLMAWNRYSQMTGVPIIGNFHIWSQLLFTRYYQQYTSHNVLPNEYQDKCSLYLKEGFSILQPPAKYTGFEQVRKHMDLLYPSVPDAFNTMFRKPLQRNIAVETTLNIVNQDL